MILLPEASTLNSLLATKVDGVSVKPKKVVEESMLFQYRFPPSVLKNLPALFACSGIGRNVVILIVPPIET